MEALFGIALDKDSRRAAAYAAAIAGFDLLDCAGGLLRIPLPFTPVPLTLQTFFVFLSGAWLGAEAGAASQLLYVFMGLSGVSVFTSGAGAFYLCGPTGGYLAGFVPAALLCGLAARRPGGYAGILTGFLCAGGLILACGTLWLAFVSGLSLRAAFMAGALPFIPGEVLKALLAAGVFLRYNRNNAIS